MSPGETSGITGRSSTRSMYSAIQSITAYPFSRNSSGVMCMCIQFTVDSEEFTVFG